MKPGSRQPGFISSAIGTHQPDSEFPLKERRSAMTRILLILAAVVFWSSAGWAAAEKQAEAWIGPEYDNRWNEHRSQLLQLWHRHSYQPANVEDCLAVGRVWYCPARQAIAHSVDDAKSFD
jgi:hypothetical protein